MSRIITRPPGRKTRRISRKTRSAAGSMLRIAKPLVRQSNVSLGNGSATASARRYATGAAVDRLEGHYVVANDDAEMDAELTLSEIAWTVGMTKEDGKRTANEEALLAEIRKLEAEQQANAEELARLKGQQLELKKQATEAAAALPTFTYRPRRGILIEAADKSWATRAFARFHYRAMFWPDRSTAAEESGFAQGDLALRRWRFGFNPSWQDDFYAFDLEFDGAGDRGLQIQKGELHVDFSKLNIYFPTLVVGIRPSAFFRRHDTNWGSSTGGFFDRSMFNDGSGIGAGSQNNGAGLYWSGVPFGPGRFLFQAIYSNQGLINVATLDRPNSNNRGVHLAFNIEPFSTLKGPLLRGIDLGVSYQLDHLGSDERGLLADSPGATRNFFRVRTTERQRLRLIELDRNARGERHLVMPHFGWRIGPAWLRTSGGINQGTQENGRGIELWYWRIGAELFAYSPKGLLTGSVTTPGSLMLFGGFERDNFRASDNGLRDCGPGGIGDPCTSAYAYNWNGGFWYFIRPALRVGAEYSFYSVNKIGRGGPDIGKAAGSQVDFHSIDLGLTFDF